MTTSQTVQAIQSANTLGPDRLMEFTRRWMIENRVPSSDRPAIIKAIRATYMVQADSKMTRTELRAAIWS